MALAYFLPFIIAHNKRNAGGILDSMCSPDGRSSDRVIALVWALTDEPQYRPVYVAPYQAAGPARLCATAEKIAPRCTLLQHLRQFLLLENANSVSSAREPGWGRSAGQHNLTFKLFRTAPRLSGWRGILPVTSSRFLSPFLHESRPMLPLLWLVQPLVLRPATAMTDALDRRTMLGFHGRVWRIF